MSVLSKEVMSKIVEEDVHFMSLQFTDIDGVAKNVEIPESQFEKALDGQIKFGGDIADIEQA